MVPRNLEAVAELRRMGGLFTFSSGRASSNFFSAVPNAAEIVNAPVSLANGACLFDAAARRSVRDYFVPARECLELAKYVRESYPDVGVRASTRKGFLIDVDDEVVYRDIGSVGDEFIDKVPWREWSEDDWYKLVIVGQASRLELIRDDCLARFGDSGLGCVFSSPRLLEWHRRDRSKASMLDTYREIYAAQGRELFICAVGDYDNDKEMLMAADMSVCPANAAESIKEICDLCLCHHSEGVIGDLLEYLKANYNDRWGKG